MSAARTLPVTAYERATATVLRAYVAQTKAMGGALVATALDAVGAAFVRYGLLAVARNLTPTGAALLARVEAAERTPEAVLRAMLAAYEADAIEKARSYYAGPGVDAALLRATNEADEAVTGVRD